MDPEAKRPDSFLTFLILAAVLVAVSGSLLCLVPMVDCPDCDAEWQRYAAELAARDKIAHEPYCDRCMDKTRITWLNRWLKGDGPVGFAK